MRDMTILDTSYLIGLLLLSLVLPLMLSLRAPQPHAFRRSCTRTVWLGQFLLGGVGIAVLASSHAAPWAMLIGVLSWGTCALALHRQLLGGVARH
jgi:hypothetical protein